MASIFTRKGEEVLIDDEDFDFVNQFTWCVDKSTGYPVSHVPGTASDRVHLHKLLAPSLSDVDHVGGNKLDARRSKLEEVSHAKNLRRQPKNPSTGIVKRGNRFIAQMKVNTVQTYLGAHKTFDLALLARIIGEIRYWGEPTQRMP